MAKTVNWNNVIYEEFCTLAFLTDIEKEIIKTRIQGLTITEQAEKFKISTRSVDRYIQTIKKKYDEVQPMSDKLPKRHKSAQEDYMDNN